MGFEELRDELGAPFTARQVAGLFGVDHRTTAKQRMKKMDEVIRAGKRMCSVYQCANCDSCHDLKKVLRALEEGHATAR